jgi:hypothetical protein
MMAGHDPPVRPVAVRVAGQQKGPGKRQQLDRDGNQANERDRTGPRTQYEESGYVEPERRSKQDEKEDRPRVGSLDPTDSNRRSADGRSCNRACECHQYPKSERMRLRFGAAAPQQIDYSPATSRLRKTR